MPITTNVPDGATPRRAHSLLISESVPDQRAEAGAWVERQLADGAKVYYKGRIDGEQAWLAGPGGTPRAARAVQTGQLELLDFSEVVRRTGGTTSGLHALKVDEVRRGLAEGWSRVAMSQESPGLTMADDDEATAYAEQEAGYDALARDWPLTTLCQLTTVCENAAAAWESAAVHYHGIVSDRWSSWTDDGRWCLHGDLDAHVVARFGAALHGAQRRQSAAGGDPDLHIDVSGVEFFDVACAQSLMLAAHAAGRAQRIVLHGAPPLLRHVVSVVGRPSALRFAGDRSAG